jgi:hypothetical protein
VRTKFGLTRDGISVVLKLNSAEIVEHEKQMKAEGERIVGEGKKRNLHLRLLGALAFQAHCPKFSFLTTRLNRVLSDVDFAAYSKESVRISAMMKELGYADQPMVTALWGDRRTIWDNPSNKMHVDIFYDKLEMNHDVSFQDRLNIDPLTISLVDMFLEKMQIVHINEKDIVDTIMLLREHDVGEAGPETVDARYIAKRLSGDWGFYYTCTTNLKKVIERLSAYQELSEDDRADVTGKIEKLLKIIEGEPKTMGWKVRARVGTGTKWYRDVEEVAR